ncbi:class I SAM-dependent methyltransferase [Lampropedia puyangensis]|uniref:Class I SAM-dependent methyltransferase n=1 Tax=Lampropedia puyangensis TaxID=1330072 RepID=A0A4S8F2M2_9BURK|nr:SAM-dependent methyltransferase [Lampropedia puyangensis]THU01548.1 class I SAM-dependent methyltransferase [Lampropedia puyangensis]
MDNNAQSVTPPLLGKIHDQLQAEHAWLPFDTFMQMALYEPGLGYYSNDRRKIGRLPAAVAPDPVPAHASCAAESAEGSDFVTAPEISALFGRSVAVQIAEALAKTGTDTIYEFGAGNGTLARDILQALGSQVWRYCIVDVSLALRERQAKTLAAFGEQVQWLSQLPDALEGVLLGNEVLDAMPVKLVVRKQGQWFERGVTLDAQQALAWDDRPTDALPPCAIEDTDEDYLTEVHPWADAFVRTTSERLKKGAALWIDYGFGEREYYHPQRHMGTLVCHFQHQMDALPLQQVGEKDITSHVNFTSVAVLAQEAGLEVLGYTSQARFLANCGIAQQLEQASLPERIMGAKLLHEHEMGELFKVIMLGAGPFWEPLGFSEGDRTHTL